MKASPWMFVSGMASMAQLFVAFRDNPCPRVESLDIFGCFFTEFGVQVGQVGTEGALPEHNQEMVLALAVRHSQGAVEKTDGHLCHEGGVTGPPMTRSR